jgi:outer membrane lipoprotein-sorting protein
MERSIFGALPEEWQHEIDEHVEHCAACRDYLEAMRNDDRAIAGFAEALEPAIARVEKGATDAAARGVPCESMENSRARRGIMRPRIAVFTAAAAALVALLWGVNHFSGIFQGTPAFADVVAKMNKAETVTYRQLLKYEGADPSAAENMATDAGLVRTTFEKFVIVRDFNKGIMLNVSPSTKRAVLEHEVGLKRDKGLFNYVNWMATLQNGPSGKFVGREKIDGVDANVFVVTNGEFQTIRIWTDPSTSLPLRIVWTNKHNPKLDVVEPTMTLYESDFGGEKGSSRMIFHMTPSDGLQKNSEWVYENFKWNQKLDPALFSVVPPKDYTLNEYQLDVSDKGEKDLVGALSAWASMSENAFPSAISDLNAQEKVRPMLIKRYDKNGDPKKELQEALEEANLLLKGLDFSQSMKVNGDWHYAGAGVKLGDKNAPLCWWKPEGAQKYRILYGDLRVADIDKADLPKAPQ